MNKKIIDEFTYLIYDTEERYKNADNKNYRFKIISYRKVISIIKGLDFDIENTDQLKDIRGIGKSTLSKIEDIIDKGYLPGLNREINSHTKENKIENKTNLMRVTGIGPKKAQFLLDENITLEILLDIDLKSNKNFNKSEIEILDKLTHHQKCGIKHFYDIERRIPYKEINMVESYLKKMLFSIDPTLNLIICGSYRRRCMDSGDIDILIYRKICNQNKHKNHTKVGLSDFLGKLKENGFIVDDLTDIGSKTKYMGFYLFDKYVRRIDVRMVSYESLPCAMLYFTGSGDFNKNMRTLALKQNISINEYGVYTVDKQKNKLEKHNIKTEEDIFKLLGIHYVEPWDRLPNYKFG